MSIATALQNAQAKVAAAYSKCNDKGATMPATQDLAHLDDCIDSIPTGSTPNLTTLNVTPTTSAQQITPTSPIDGYDEVNVSAVTAAIDANIIAGNIKKDVSILGVTGSYEGGGDWLLATRISSPYSGSLVDITAAQGAQLAQLGAKNGGFYYLFKDCGLRDVDLSGVTKIKGGYGAFLACVSMRSILFPDLTEFESSCGEIFASCRALTSVSFPELTKVSSTNGLRSAFVGCWGLTSISFPKLTQASAETAFWQAFDQCVALTTITIHPDALQNSGLYYNPLVSASMITTLIFSQMATNDVYMTWCTNLSTDSILGILNKLDNTVTGKTCAFPTKTIASSDPNYAAISAKIAELTNWTITGLTL